MVDSTAFPSRNGITRDVVSGDVDGSVNRGSDSIRKDKGARSMAISMARKTSSFFNNTLVSSQDALSDISTAAYSGLHKYGWLRSDEDPGEEKKDIDNSSHSLTRSSERNEYSNRNFSVNRNDMERGGYEPPSPSSLELPSSPPPPPPISSSIEEEEEVVTF